MWKKMDKLLVLQDMHGSFDTRVHHGEKCMTRTRSTIIFVAYRNEACFIMQLLSFGKVNSRMVTTAILSTHLSLFRENKITAYHFFFFCPAAS